MLPFPNTILRPNNKSHWGKKLAAKNALKDGWYIVGLENRIDAPQGNLGLMLMFYPPNNRWDLDAMLSASKSGLDGLAIAWGVNDKLFRPITIDAVADKNAPRVEISLAFNDDAG